MRMTRNFVECNRDKLKDSRNTMVRMYETFLKICVRIEEGEQNFLVYPIHRGTLTFQR